MHTLRLRLRLHPCLRPDPDPRQGARARTGAGWRAGQECEHPCRWMINGGLCWRQRTRAIYRNLEESFQGRYRSRGSRTAPVCGVAAAAFAQRGRPGAPQG